MADNTEEFPFELQLEDLQLAKKKTEENQFRQCGGDEEVDDSGQFIYVDDTGKVPFCRHCMASIQKNNLQDHHRKNHAGYYRGLKAVHCGLCAKGLSEFPENKQVLTMHLAGKEHRAVLERYEFFKFCTSCRIVLPAMTDHAARCPGHDLVPASSVHMGEGGQYVKQVAENKAANRQVIVGERAKANQSMAAKGGGAAKKRSRLAHLVFSNGANPITVAGKEYLWNGKFCAECIGRATGEYHPAEQLAGLCLVKARSDGLCYNQQIASKYGQVLDGCGAPLMLMIRKEAVFKLMVGKDVGQEAMESQQIV